MFATADINEVFQQFPPVNEDGLFPSLVQSSEGHSFIHHRFLETQLKNLLRCEDFTNNSARTLPVPPSRRSVSNLAKETGVDQDSILKLAEGPSSSWLCDASRSAVVTENETSILKKTLSDQLADGVVSKTDFVSEYDIHITSIERLLRDIDEPLISVASSVWTEAYERHTTKTISEMLEDSITNVSSMDIMPEDIAGHPPIWFISRILGRIADSPNIAEKLRIRETQQGFQCTPRKVLESRKDAVFHELRSGSTPFVNLQTLLSEYPESFATLQEIHVITTSMPEILTVDDLAISRVWMSKIAHLCSDIIDQNGHVQVRNQINQTFSAQIQERVLMEIEAQVPEISKHKLHPIGDYIITKANYDKEKLAILHCVAEEADAKWEKLHHSTEIELQFSLTSIASRLQDVIQKLMLAERSTKRLLEEHFWSIVAEKEAENETEFSKYWKERVVSRINIYNAGLAAVEDGKLRTELTELLAGHAKTDLVPDAINDARTQGLILSRRTRKNLQKLEGKIATGEEMSISSLLATINRFNERQDMAPDASIDDRTRDSMIQDMKKRMHKQKKSDGPVFFLTLVMLLFAMHSNGVIYATGKFAPKLLKQLKANIPRESYEMVERWKEAAKSSNLGLQDREEMRKMVDA